MTQSYFQPPSLLFSRTEQVFNSPISYETEVQLERGNAEYHTTKKMLTLRTKAKSDILNGVIEDFYKYTAYPTDIISVKWSKLWSINTHV